MTDELTRLAELDKIYRQDLGVYCASLVRIKAKGGQETYLYLNRIQQYVDERLRQQREEMGRVRALILKGRQMGVSTYVGARFYRKTTMNFGQRTYILSHEDKTTQALFGMAKRIHEGMEPEFKPVATTDNANELDFSGVQSDYRVGTAKNVSGLGRGMTIQNLHGSETAYWQQAHVHFAGIMEAVPQMNGTEIILESTANGVGGVFYDQWDFAERGKSEYIAIFLPWYWHHEYRQKPKDDFEPSTEELEYAGFYDLDADQVCWMHYKNIALGAKPGEICWQFRQEYPGYANEAFQTSGDESFIQPELVLRARNFTAPEQKYAARVMGVDVAYGGPDDTRLLDRCGQKLGGLVDEVMDTDDPMQIVGRICHLIDKHKIQMTFVDITGGGGGVVPRLIELGYGSRVRGVNFAKRAHNEQLYKNKRAEMWGRMRDWLRDEAGADVPDNNIVQKHLCAPGYKEDSNGRMQLEDKRKIKKRLKFSPDWGDAGCLTFAENVRQPIEHTPGWREQMERESAMPQRDWMTV